MKLVIIHDIQIHKNRVLYHVFIHKKKCKQRNKRLNLINKESTTELQFFSSIKVLKTKTF